MICLASLGNFPPPSKIEQVTGVSTAHPESFSGSFVPRGSSNTLAIIGGVQHLHTLLIGQVAAMAALAYHVRD